MHTLLHGGTKTKEQNDKFLRIGLAACWLALACAPHALPPRDRVAEPAQKPDFQVIAHRGGAAHAPENTLPAFRWSLANGFEQVELDVRLSLDEVLVLYHDDTLERKTGHEGSVGVYAAEELTGFELGSWFDREHPEVAESFAGTTIVTLSELFREFGDRLYYHVEIKGEDPRVPALLSREVAAAGLADRVTVTSFSFVQLTRFQRLAPEIPLCWLLDRSRDPVAAEGEPLSGQRARVDRARRAGFSQVAVAASEISPQIVAFAHANDIGIRGWGLKSVDDEQRVIDAGSDGATTDWPRRLTERVANAWKPVEETSE